MTVLLVVLTILFFLGMGWMMRWVRARSEVPPLVPANPAPVPALPVRIPDGIFFARSHTWVNLFPSGKVRVGVDDFIGRLLERPAVVFLKQVGDAVDRGEPILKLVQNTHSFTVRSPISGSILSRNDGLSGHPGQMKEMLFTDGWAYSIQPEQPTDVRHLIFGKESREWMKAEFVRLRDVLAGVDGTETTAPILLQDGGLPVASLMRTAPEGLWKSIEREFLSEKR